MKPLIFHKQAILFDLDGVLVDSKVPVERSWADWARRHHLDVTRVVAESHGRRTLDAVRMFAPHLDAEKEAAALDHREATDLSGLRAVSGAHQLLAEIPPERWAVATSGADQVARTRLRALNFPIPRVLISSDSVEQGKPAPEPTCAPPVASGSVLSIAWSSKMLPPESNPRGLREQKSSRSPRPFPQKCSQMLMPCFQTSHGFRLKLWVPSFRSGLCASCSVRQRLAAALQVED